MTSPLQVTRDAVRDYFARGGDSRQVLYLVLTLLALIALLVIIHRIMGRAHERGHANQPRKLFRNVLAKLNLAVRDRDLLRRIARDLRMEHPATLVLSPLVFRAQADRWLAGHSGAGDQAKQMDALCHALFGQPLSPIRLT